MRRKIVVFAGNQCKKDRQDYYFSLAYKTGKLLADSGFVVVTGGGPGLMNQVSRGAFECSGHTIGICLEKQGISQSKYLTEKVIYTTLRARQRKLLSLGDGYLALPGGIGTLYEILEILGLKRKGEIPKSVPLVIYKDYYKNFIKVLDEYKSEGFITVDLDMMIKRAESAQDVVGKFKRYFKVYE